jgi:hypothetical protein
LMIFRHWFSLSMPLPLLMPHYWYAAISADAITPLLIFIILLPLAIDAFIIITPLRHWHDATPFDYAAIDIIDISLFHYWLH